MLRVSGISYAYYIRLRVCLGGFGAAVSVCWVGRLGIGVHEDRYVLLFSNYIKGIEEDKKVIVVGVDCYIVSEF